MKRRLQLLVVGLLFFGLAIFAWGKPPQASSETERRLLAKAPALTGESLLSGEFMTDFEAYTQDQFPLRDGFRGLKAALSLGLFQNLDKDGLYLARGHAGKLVYPQSEPMLEHSAERLQFLYDTYWKDTDVNLYLSVVPDKGAFLGKATGRLALDYEAFAWKLQEKTPYMTYVEIASLLHLEDYYTTDPHWRQERLEPLAQRLGEAMGTSLRASYEEKEAGPFVGAYAGQLALPMKADALVYLTNDILEACTVTGYATGKPEPGVLYDLPRAQSRDPYEIYLSGAQPLLVIENPKAATDRELVIFRDSFGSSLAPLLVEGYAKVTLVDIRYMRSETLGRYLEFTDQDVLVLLSTLVLNDSLALQ